MTTDDRPIMLFDGECRLCCWNVQFVIRRDPHRRVRFAAMQSAAGSALLRARNLPARDFTSVAVIDGGRVLVRSAAVMRILEELCGAWPIVARVLKIVPRPLRDAAYDFVARHRYRWFGRRPTCLVPSPDIAARFLD
jgi:predicted DCC family thiol-disulfide oxidoreductase YuxK